LKDNEKKYIKSFLKKTCFIKIIVLYLQSRLEIDDTFIKILKIWGAYTPVFGQG